MNFLNMCHCFPELLQRVIMQITLKITRLWWWTPAGLLFCLVTVVIIMWNKTPNTRPQINIYQSHIKRAKNKMLQGHGKWVWTCGIMWSHTQVIPGSLHWPNPFTLSPSPDSGSFSFKQMALWPRCVSFAPLTCSDKTCRYRLNDCSHL